MLFVPCEHCFSAVRVLDVDTDLVGAGSEFWPDKYTCVVCTAPCRAYAESEVSATTLLRMKVHDLTSAEYLNALAGNGLPHEMQCDVPTVQELFQKPVRAVALEPVPGTTRSILQALEFADGTLMYLGSSPLGAVIYRITRQPSTESKT